MNNVIGPINREAWETLKSLRIAIRHSLRISKDRYKSIIEEERYAYKNILKSFMKEVA